MASRCITKWHYVAILLVISIALSACSIPHPIPEEGIWYCEDLGIEIDFSYLNEKMSQNCAKKYNSDGTYQSALCRIDYGCGINIGYDDWQEYYLVGRFSYRNGTFFVTSYEDNVTYEFVRIDG